MASSKLDSWTGAGVFIVWNCREELQTLSSQNHVKLSWVPGNSNIKGNVVSDNLARIGSMFKNKIKLKEMSIEC
uniref:RNase H type-1 domain-containing protein n=1 Tax=Megaselia scalaris TaxID=36166 RepID=T1GSR9_MEGSC